MTGIPQTEPHPSDVPDVAPASVRMPVYPTFREAFVYWLRLGFISFGGPAGQIAVMHTELVEKRRWISEAHFLHALNFCMLLPGPEAQQLATYLGWRLHGWRGGVAAGALFVLPSVFLLYALSWIYIQGASLPWLAGLFYGLQTAVIAVVFSALMRVGRKALKTKALWVVATLSFVAIFAFKISFVVVILAAAAIGMAGHQLYPRQFPAGTGQGHGAAAQNGGRSSDHSDDDDGSCLKLPPPPAATLWRAFQITFICLTLWWLPIIVMGWLLGWGSTPFAQGIFFSKAALITFGGAYAVLPYVAQQAVEKYGWLTHGQMMSGLGFAETTPGPLIIVLQFVGFVGGWQHPGALEPWQAATLGAFITTWATFVPSFLMVFLGAPHVEHLRASPRLSAALTGITAAVVGVILNLAIWFAWHTLWPAGWQPAVSLTGLDLFAAIAGAAAFIAMERFKVDLMLTIGICAAVGLLWRTFL